MCLADMLAKARAHRLSLRAAPKVDEKEFDFESANSRFNKDAVFTALVRHLGLRPAVRCSEGVLVCV